MKLGSSLVPPVIFATLVASALIAPAQTPDPGTVAQENRDIAGRWLGASDAAVQELGKVGGTLTDAATGKFTGLSKAIAMADWSSTLGAATAGDVRGAVSGAVAIKVGATAAAGGAALFGEAGAVAGGMVGSFFPVIGNIAGSIVGGAVGTAAGGFIAAFGYDKYLKDFVTSGATGIISVFDRAPLNDAMEAKRAFLWATMAPEERAQLTAFKPEEVTLLDFGTLPYVPALKPPTPGVQQQATLGDAVPSSFVIIWDTQPDASIPCTISGQTVSCVDVRNIGGGQMNATTKGTVTSSELGITLDVYNRTIWRSGGQCPSTTEYVGPAKIVLEKGGRAVTSGSHTATVVSQSGPCVGGPKTWSSNFDNVTGKWRPN